MECTSILQDLKLSRTALSLIHCTATLSVTQVPLYRHDNSFLFSPTTLRRQFCLFFLHQIK